MQKKGESQRAIDIVGIGENSVDLLATLPALPAPDTKAELQSLVTLPGGQVATALVGCARLGLRTAYVGSFGNDAHGAMIREALAQDGVDISHSRTVKCANRTALIIVESEARTRTVLWTRPPALDWNPVEAPLAVIANARALMVDTTDMPLAIAAARVARDAGTFTIADVDDDVPGLDALLASIDVLVVSSRLAPRMRELHTRGPKLVVATLGAHGAVAWDGTREVYSPGFHVPVVDTTGAGDAFRAGLVTALLELPNPGPWTLSDLGPAGPRTVPNPGPWTQGPWTLSDLGPAEPWTRNVLDFSNAVAALNCRAAGAQTGLPTRAEVDRLVTSSAGDRSKRAWDPGRRELPHVPWDGDA